MVPTSISGGGMATVVMDGPGLAFRLAGTRQGKAAPEPVKPEA